MRTLKINLSYHCTASCAHCRFGCTNEGPFHEPDIETPYRTALRLKERFGLDLAVLLGGEPSIFTEKSLTLLRNLHAAGIAVRVETNASWAGSPERAMAYLEPLRRLDANVMLSMDAFHEPFVPVGNLINAIRACVALGVRYNLETPYLDPENHAYPEDVRTDEIFREIQSAVDAKIPRYVGGTIFTGRAAVRFGDAFSKGKGVPACTCEAVPWWMDGAIASTGLLIYEPGGWITKGCGIAIGNVFRQDLIEMLEGYDANAHPIFSVLLREGPLGLARMAQKRGYALKPDYADKCHLCHEARQVLKPDYDQVLQPDQHYGIIG